MGTHARLCLQPHYWMEMVCDSMAVHLGNMEDPNEYMLSKDDAAALRNYVMGPLFDPFLEALDPDNERVEGRKRRVEKLHLFKAHRRDRGMRELHRWLQLEDNAEEYDAERYAHMPFAKTPNKFSKWVELIDASSRLDHDQDVAGIISKALLDLMSFVHNVSWKMDYLLANCRSMTADKETDDPFEDFLTKHPFLSRCDDHVAKVRNSHPVQLSRTSAVSPCVPAYHVYFRHSTQYVLTFHVFFGYIL
jgi:hypothetical protein